MSLDPGNHFQVYLIKTDGRGLVGVYNPGSLKQDVIAELDTLNPQSKGLAKKIKKAKKHIEKSLEEKRWLDETHLHHKHGSKVFHEEKKAVKDIKKLCKKGEFPGEFCERLIGMLVEADSILARVAIDDAIAAGGKEKEIEKAEKEMAKAEKDKNKGKYDKAIDHYKHAWQHAMKAMKKHKKQNQMMEHTRSESGTVLLQNRPNPVISSTRFEFVLDHAAEARLTVHDAAGRKVWESAPSLLAAGQHSLEWDCLDQNGTRLPAGGYIYTLATESFSQTRKMVIIH
ncbi:T9SS type A sorting domain-containing protein [candidate division TA06 bacterium]|uniref:T9SS type A sorting domain-containing protein n=1 Tax=candidate division TA06 bacterium TaxID=2250710 RepID=A0A523XNV7_UNCT6|nr:MAG: T9SS type A sorting domain-containing protein [candidate division TA06 bacterium]